MKNVPRILLACLFVVFMSGCALHNGYMNNSASLASPNFTYAKQNIQGYAEAWYILGICGLEREALVEEAKREMLKGVELMPNQALANVTVNWKNSFFIVVNTTKCTVTADIVEFK